MPQPASSKLLIVAVHKEGEPRLVALRIPMPDPDFLDTADAWLTEAGYEPGLSSVAFYDELLPAHLITAFQTGRIPEIQAPIPAVH